MTQASQNISINYRNVSRDINYFQGEHAKLRVPEKDPKVIQKWIRKGATESEKSIGFPCVLLQKWSRKVSRNLAKKWSGNEPEMDPALLIS